MIGSRIKEMRKQAGLTQAALGQKLGVIKQTISSWENNVSEPCGDTLAELSKVLNTTPNYLLGISDISGNDSIITSSERVTENRYVNEEHIKAEHGYFFFFFDSDNSEEKDTFLKRLASAIADNEMDNEAFAEAVSIDTERASAIVGGECDPSAGDLIEISRCLNTSIDYLLGETPALSSSERKLLNTFVKLDEDNKDILIGKAKELLLNQRYQSSVAADVPLREAK